MAACSDGDTGGSRIIDLEDFNKYRADHGPEDAGDNDCSHCNGRDAGKLAADFYGDRGRDGFGDQGGRQMLIKTKETAEDTDT